MVTAISISLLQANGAARLILRTRPDPTNNPEDARVRKAGRLTLSLCLLCSLLGGTTTAFDRADVDKKLAAIATYERGMDRQPLIAFEKLIRQSQNQPEQRKYIEQRLARLLADATLEGKSFICKQLWFIGTADSVPAVARLLTDEKTVDMACYAIGQNPSPEAGAALRDALGKTGPDVQVRIINLLGDRRDIKSIKVIGERVFGEERLVAEAAVAALGKIGGEQARIILSRARATGDSDLRFAATDAYLLCAEDFAAEGNAAQATAIYTELAGEGEPRIFRSAAIKGLADVGGPGAASLVVAALYDDDRMVRGTAMGCVRTMRGDGLTERFAAELPKMPHSSQVLLIDALANREDRAALPAIITAVGDASTDVRTAALNALASLGDASCVDLLVRAMATDSQKEKKAARFALANLDGTDVDNVIVRNMQSSQGHVRAELIQILHDRNAVAVVPALLGETAHPDAKVRKAAFKALGRLASEKDLPSLVELLVKIEDDNGRKDAERAVIAASRKISDQNIRADTVLDALSTEERVPVRCSLLRTLGGIANSKALAAMIRASKEKDAAVQDTAVRALTKWPNTAAAEVLLEIYCGTPNRVHRLLALRGFVRLLALPTGDLSIPEKLQMCRRAVRAARDAQEKRLVLSGLANVDDPEALTMVEPFLQGEEVRAEAATAAIRIAGAIMETQSDPEQITCRLARRRFAETGRRNRPADR
jgi:HEAT repeat protein